MASIHCFLLCVNPHRQPVCYLMAHCCESIARIKSYLSVVFVKLRATGAGVWDNLVVSEPHAMANMTACTDTVKQAAARLRHEFGGERVVRHARDRWVWSHTATKSRFTASWHDIVVWPNKGFVVCIDLRTPEYTAFNCCLLRSRRMQEHSM